MNVPFILVLLIFLQLVNASAPTNCPDASFSRLTGRCYKLVTAAPTNSYTVASQYCSTNWAGGTLASMSTLNEFNQVSGLCSGGQSCWVGLQRKSPYSLTDFVWDFQPTTYTSWTAGWGGSPPAYNSGTQDLCVYIKSGRWYTTPCTFPSNINFVCVVEAKCNVGLFRNRLYTNGTQGQCLNCIAGTYSDTVGAVTCTPCLAGYAGSAGASTRFCTQLCKRGYYCPTGTALNAERNCGAGTYGPTTGLTNSSQCLPCQAGYYCAGLTTGAVDGQGRLSLTGGNYPCNNGRCSLTGAGSCTNCVAGYYSPNVAGVGVVCPGFECGSVDSYCPYNQHYRKYPVSNGYYGSNPAVPGNTTWRTQTVCPAGKYCIGGVARTCPAGTASGNGYASCVTCAAGYYCPPGSTSRFQFECSWTRNRTLQPDLDKYYCPAGTPEVLIAPYGYYTTGGNVYTRTSIVNCPYDSNNYCVNGTRTEIMSLNRCQQYDFPEGYGCLSTQVPCPNENTSYIWSNFDYTLAPTFKNWPHVIYALNSSLTYVGTDNPNCYPEGVMKNEDLYRAYDNGDIRVLRRGFARGPNYEVCLEGRGNAKYAARFLYQTWGDDPVTGFFRNISLVCTVTVRIADRNEPPYFPYKAKYLQVKEKVEAGLPLHYCNAEGINAGCPPCNPSLSGSCDQTDEVLAYDRDYFDTFTHAIVENDNTTDREGLFANETESSQWKFTIEPCSGKMSVLNQNALVYRTAPRMPDGSRVVHYKVIATDRGGLKTVVPIDVYVYIINVNDAPILSPSDSFTFYIPENSPAGTAFSPGQPAYFDEDDDICSFFDATSFIPYNGLDNGKTFFSFNADSTLRVTLAAVTAQVLNFEQQIGQYAVTVTAADGNGGFDTMTYPIVITDQNDAPVFMSYGPFSVVENQISVVCSANSAPNGICGVGEPITTSDEDRAIWPNDITLYSLVDSLGLFSIDPLTGVISTTAPLNYETSPLLAIPGQYLRGYSVRVNATSSGIDLDMTPQSTVISVQILVVNENEPPAFTSVPLYTALETHPVGVALTSIPTFVSDPDDVNLQPGELSSAITYAVVPNSSPYTDYFICSNGPGRNQVQFTLNHAIDFESTPLCSFSSTRRCIYVGISAFDGITTIYSNITLEVLDVNEAPTYGAVDLGTLTIAENTPLNIANGIILNNPTYFFATDPDIFMDQNLLYTIVSGTGQSLFSLVSFNSPSVNSNRTAFYDATYIKQYNFDYESGNTQYVLSVQVRDSGPSSFIGKNCFSNSDCGPYAFCSGNRCQESCYSASGSVPRKIGPEMGFYCNYTGSTQTFIPFDSTLGTITINVLDANDPPVLQAPEMNPCRWNASVVLQFVSSSDQVAISSLASYTTDQDPVDTYFNYTIDNSFVANGYHGNLWDNGFTLGLNSGRLELPRAGLNYLLFSLFNVLAGRIVITDPRGANSTCIIAVMLDDYNIPPILNPNSTSIPENSPPGLVVFTVVASDPADTVTYSIPQNPNFVIDPNTGVITTSSSVNLDFETQPQHTLVVRAKDSRNAETVALYTINLINVNDPPYFAGLPSVVYFPEVTGAGSKVGSPFQPYVFDQDSGDRITFSILDCTPSQACPFVLSNVTAGQISIWSGFTGVTDFETLPNTWSFRLQITDLNGGSAIALIVLALTNVNEAPYFSAPRYFLNVTENTLQSNFLDLNAISGDPDFGDARSFALVNSPTSLSINGQGVLGIVSMFDYEDITSYEIMIRAMDSGGLMSFANITLSILNVNDLTITSITPSLLTSCDSGQWVTIAGTNFGMKHSWQPSAIVSGKYKNSYVEYSSTNCTISVRNNEIKCLTVPGAGANLVWNLSISVPSDPSYQNHVVLSPFYMSFPDPVITSVSPIAKTLATPGGETFRIFGTCLGTKADRITITPQNLQVCTSDALSCYNPACFHDSISGSINCTSTPGIGANLSVQATIASKVSNRLDFAISYLPPTVLTINVARVSTFGSMPLHNCCQICYSGYTPCGDECLAPGAPVCKLSQGCACRTSTDNLKIIIAGKNFAGLNAVPDIAYARNTFTDSLTDLPSFADRIFSGCLVTKPYEEVSCNTIAPGVGYNMTIMLSFGNQLNLETGAYLSYDRPTITSFAGYYSRASTAGGQIIEIRGTNFGPICGGQAVGVILAGCSWVYGTYTANSRNPVTGSLIVYYPPCRVVSQTLIFCLTVPGTGADLRWTLAIGDQSSMHIENFRSAYSPPVVGGYTGPGADRALTTGYQDIFLAGSQFGPVDGAAIVAQYGSNPTPEFLAANCSVTIANEQIVCKTSEGAGTDLKWFVVVDGQSSVNAQTNYGAPVVETISGAGIDSTTEGGDTVTIIGYNFGPPSFPGPYFDRAVYGPPSNPYAFETTCTVVSHTNLTCTTVPGIGRGMEWRVTVRGQTSSASPFTTSYRSPSLTSLSQHSGNTEGGAVIRISGFNMALCDRESVPYVQWGLEEQLEVSNRKSGIHPNSVALVCPSSSLVQKEVSIVVPPMRASKYINISYALVSARFNGDTFPSTNSLTFEYEDPVIYDVFAVPTSDITLLRVTITGKNFCASEACCKTIIDDGIVIPQDVETHTHQEIVFFARNTGSVQIRCGNFVTIKRAFTAEDPFIVATTPKLSDVSFRTVGGAQIIVWGLYFGLSSPGVYVGNRRANVSAHESVLCQDNLPDYADFTATGVSIFCWKTTFTLPAGEGKNELLSVVNGNQTSHYHSADFERVHYLPPVLSSNTPVVFSNNPNIQVTSGRRRLAASYLCCFKTDGSDPTIVTVNGDNLGTTGTIWLGFEGNIKANVVSWSHTQVVATIPAGEGKNLRILFFSGDQEPIAGPPEVYISYAPPTVTSIDRGVGPVSTTGGAIITIYGANFGRPYVSDCVSSNCTSNPPVVRLVGSSIFLCDVVSGSQTTNSLQCQIPEGAGANLAVRITIADQMTQRDNAFSYDPPQIYSVTPQLVPTSGLDNTGSPFLMTITGINFGVTDLCVKIVDPRPGQPNFAIAVRAVTQPSLFGCYQLGGSPPPDVLPTPSHTTIQLQVPEFHGANVSVIIEAGSQASINVGTYSYIPPVVTSVRIGNRTWSNGAGRVIGDTAFAAASNDSSVLSYGDWSNNGDSRDLCRTSTFYGRRGISWKEVLEIEADGDFVRTKTYYNDTECVENPFLRINVRGKFIDQGNHLTLYCSRIFQQTVTAITVTPLSPDGVVYLQQPTCSCPLMIFELNVPVDMTVCYALLLIDADFKNLKCPLISMEATTGFGMYFIADNTRLFMMDPPLLNNRDEVDQRESFQLPDLATATVTSPQSLDTPTGPTEGCHQWERQDAFLSRLALAQKNGETTSRLCLDPALITLTGSNFGVVKPGLAAGLVVLFYQPETGNTFEASSLSRGGDAGVICSTCTQTHNEIVVQIPPGAGKNLFIKVLVGLGVYAQSSQTPYPLFHYQAPYILESVPGTVSRSKGFTNAQSEQVALRGYNFGGKASNTTILIGGKLCKDASWASGALDVDGVPFLGCAAPRDVVGPKSVFVCVARQATVTSLFRDDALTITTGQALGIWASGVSSTAAITYTSQMLSSVNSRCKSSSNGTQYYSDMFGLCQPCPVGADCIDLPETRFGPPPATASFYRFKMKTFDASGAVPLRTQQRCNQETWNTTLLSSQYPTAILSEQCYDYVGCTPPESCAGGNTCSTGYQYALDECRKFHDTGLDSSTTVNGTGSLLPYDVLTSLSNKSSCRVYLDVYTGAWTGVQTDCNPTGVTCKPGQPEYCSECTVAFAANPTVSGDPIPFGYCKCTEPERCAFCTIYKYYRLNGDCAKCPDNPALLIAMFFVLAAFFIGAGYFLQKKNFNLAFISIGVDYFQVLALFSATKVQWPPLIYQIFALLSLLNFNIDITAPECLVPTLEYDFKWYMMETIPLMMLGLMLLVHLGYTARKCYKVGHRADANSHVSRFVAVYLTAIYYLYINLTKKALDVFNCNPADPDDGFYYASFTSLACEGSVCRCGESVQASLVPWAVLALVGYSLGFPFFIATRLYAYRYEVMEDQYLRATGIGESRLTNVNAYDVRKRYSKLYFHFKPEYYYWILVILNRKFWIVFAGLMFRGNTAFQLAVVLLVLFICYVLQVTNRPYMSTGEKPKVRENLDLYVKKSLTNPKYAWYPEIQQNVMEARRRFLKKKRKQLMVRFDEEGDKEDHVKKEVDEKHFGNDIDKDISKDTKKDNYFFDYNTVEATLLACAVLICLIGVMFESGRFNSARKDLQGQQEFLTWCLIIVIFGSIIYYFIVFIGEMWQITGSNKCVKFFMKKKVNDKVTQQDIDDLLVLDTNPMHAELAASPLDIKQKHDDMEAALQKESEKNQKLTVMLEETKRIAAQEMANFERLLAQGVVQETEEDDMDNGEDAGGTSFQPRMSTAPSGLKKGRGKGTGLADLVKGKRMDPSTVYENERHGRTSRVPSSKKSGKLPNPVITGEDDLISGNPIFQKERKSNLRAPGQDEAPGIKSFFRKSIVAASMAFMPKSPRAEGATTPSGAGKRGVFGVAPGGSGMVSPIYEEEKNDKA